MSRRSFPILAMALALAGLAHAQSDAPSRKASLIGIVLPSDARPGDRVSGSILLYPSAVTGISGLHVERTKVDIDENQPRKAVLSGIVVDAGVQKRTADQNLLVDVPPGAKSVHVVLSRNDQQIAAVDVPIEATTSEPLLCGSYDWTYGTEQDGSKSNFRTPLTYCYAGIAVIAGTFNGDAQQTSIEAGGETGRIVAESPRYCYWLLPIKAWGPAATSSLCTRARTSCSSA